MMTQRRQYAMSALEYKVLKGQWGTEPTNIFFDICERCYKENWLTTEGVLTPRGVTAIALYEAFRQQEREELDDEIPWMDSNDNVVSINHTTIRNQIGFHTPLSASSIASATLPALPAPENVAPEDKVVVKVSVLASRSSSRLAAPETEEMRVA